MDYGMVGAIWRRSQRVPLADSHCVIGCHGVHLDVAHLHTTDESAAWSHTQAYWCCVIKQVSMTTLTSHFFLKIYMCKYIQTAIGLTYLFLTVHFVMFINDYYVRSKSTKRQLTRSKGPNPQSHQNISFCNVSLWCMFLWKLHKVPFTTASWNRPDVPNTYCQGSPQ